MNTVNFEYIPRSHEKNIADLLEPGKVVVLYGARRAGKTTLVKRLLEKYAREKNTALFVTAEDIVVRQFLESESVQKLKEFVGGNQLLVIDEAQHAANIGLNLKLIVDHMPGLSVIATGSSSFDLAQATGEPLTGRRHVLTLHPLAQLEISHIESAHETEANLESRLVYGSYPEVVTTAGNHQREEYLRELVNAYLLKDILKLEGVRQSDKLVRLLQLLAFQIGREVSLSELGTQLGMSKNTVERYIDLLEKVFVLHRLTPFSRNLRKEISKSHRLYFCDNGVRNAVIGNFNPLKLRNDDGQLWENYIVMERLKRHENLRERRQSWFWRTYDKKEIDLVEEKEGRLAGYEIKWQPKHVKPPADWIRAYPEASYEVIDRENYRGFIE